MAAFLERVGPSRLERSCDRAAADWIRIGPSRPGFERIEAYFSGRAFESHRHDTYAIGYTLQGVQSFGYRGAPEHSLAGQVMVLHPDEVHDGYAGTDAGFRYRIMYVEPSLVQAALGEAARPLPFVRDAVSSDKRLVAATVPALADLETPLEDLHFNQIVVGLADALAAVDRSRPQKPASPVAWRAVRRTRDFLDDNAQVSATSEQLEAISGLSRYALARHFRAAFGTSPYRYLVMRRLDRVRHLVLEGGPLCDAAAASGFADQSHMTRHFKRAYGISPGRWASMCRKGRTLGGGGRGFAIPGAA